MGIFADLIPEIKPESVEQQLEIQQPKLPADPQGVTPVGEQTPGLFSDLVNPQEKFQPGIVDRFLLALDKPVKAGEVVVQGIKQASLNTIDNLLGVEQWVGEAVAGLSPKGETNHIIKWGKNLAESSKAVAQEFDTYRSEHPEEAMQISPDAGFWEATKQIVTSPENMTKGLIQAIPMMMEAWAGGAAFKFAGLAPRTLAVAQRWGRIGGIASGMFGSNYSDARKKNVSPEAATAQAFLTSMGEAVIEEWTLGKKIGLFKSAKAALLKKSMGRLASTVLIGGSKAYARGAGEEATQQLNSNFWNFVFADRSQELMKGVSQAAAIGGPMEMVMAGVFTGAGIAARQKSKIDQLNSLDKFDDFIGQTNLKDSEKAEARQVIENKRQEIGQTSILPTEEDVETTPQGEIVAEESPAGADVPVMAKKPTTFKEFRLLLNEKWAAYFGNKRVGGERGGGYGNITRPYGDYLYKQDRPMFESMLRRYDTGEDIGNPEVGQVIKTTPQGEIVAEQAPVPAKGKWNPPPNLTLEQFDDWIHNKGGPSGRAKSLGTEDQWVYYQEQQIPTKAEQPVQVIKKPSFDELQPENIPEISPEELHREVKVENGWENTVDIIIKGIESASEPLAEQEGLRKKELAIKAAKLGEKQADPYATFAEIKNTLGGEVFHQTYESITITPEQQQALAWHIRESPTLIDKFDRMDAEGGLISLLQGREIQPAELRKLRDALGKKGEDLADVIVKKRGKKPKLYQWIGAAFSSPISLMSSGEMSGLGRQGWFVGLLSLNGWKKGFNVAHTIALAKDYEAVARKYQLELETHPKYKFMKDTKDGMGIEFTDWRTSLTGEETLREEHYRSQLLKSVPGVGQLVGRSEAAYTVQLNTQRFYAALKFIDAWAGTNKTDTDYKMLGTLINLSSGRGDISALKTIVPLVTAGFFSPKLFMSRFQLPAHLLRTMVKSPAVFKIMAQQTAEFVGLGALALAMLAAIPGVGVEDDPESSDFGKIKYGNLRISYWQGYEQIARLTAQLASGKRKSVVTNRRIATERREIVLSYLRSKVSPGVGLAWDALSGKKFDGSPFEQTAMSYVKGIGERMYPMFWGDLVDAVRYEGLDGLVMAAPAGFYGLSLGAYPVRPEQQAVLVKEDLSHRTFGKGWDEIGPIAQQLLREHNPQIEQSEAVAKQQRDGHPYMDEIFKERALSKKRIYRSLPDNVQDEIDMSYADIGELSRQVGNDWYLNDKNYENYKADVSKYLNKILPKLVASDGYKLLTTDQKKAMLEDVASQVKTAVRKRIIDVAERKDIQDLQERTKK